MTTSNVAETALDWTEADKTAVRAVPDRIRDAWAANDAEAFAAAYTADATMILSGDRFMKGRAQILQEVKASFAGGHKGTTLLQNIVDARYIGANTAIVITDGGVLAPGETKPHPEREIRATWVIAKEDGEWRIAAYQNSRNADGKLPGA